MNEQPNASKRRIRFNWLDGAIILLIVLCAVGIFFRYQLMDTLGMGNELKNYCVSFTLSEVDSSLPDFLAEGNRLYLPSGEEAGRLLTVSDATSATASGENGGALLTVTPASKYIDDGQGNVVLAYYPDGTRINASGRFECRGSLSDDGVFSIGGRQAVSVGQQLTLYTDTVTLYITVTAITPVVD